MPSKLFSCLFVLTVAVIACEGDSRYFHRNPNYRDLYYQNQFYGGLSHPNPESIQIRTMEHIARKVDEINDATTDQNDDTEDGILGQEKALLEASSSLSGSKKGVNDPSILRPIILSLRTSLRDLLKSQNESKETLNNILSVLADTLAWQKTQATSFYSLISGLTSSS